MNATPTADRTIPAALLALSLVPSIAGIARLAVLAGDAPITPENARFVTAPLPIVLHILAVVPFSILGALQFSPAFRRRRPEWHRAAGRVLAPLGLVAALTGLWMTLFYPVPEIDRGAVHLLRLAFGSAMAVSIALALDALRRRDFEAHGAWMARGYAIGLGAGTQVLTHLPWFILVGEMGDVSRPVAMGAAWLINLGIAEWWIRVGRRTPPSRTRAASGAPGRPGGVDATASTR